MEWATRRKIRISRAATAWAIRRFADPSATFFFGSDDDVRDRERQGAIGFHTAGTRFPKESGRPTPIEQIAAQYRPDDLALQRIAELVRDADGPAGQEQHPEAAGLRLMTVAFPDICDDDQEIVRRSEFLYDALYASLTKIVRAVDKQHPPPEHVRLHGCAVCDGARVLARPFPPVPVVRAVTRPLIHRRGGSR